MTPIIDTWRRTQLMRSAFAEHKAAMRDVYALADEVLQSPDGTPNEYAVAMGRIPRGFYSLRKNLFSVLFMSVYFMLDIAEDRRALYGKLNHLFRTWVTSADNLLDNESKVVLPIRMPGESRIMREVVAVMTADRILNAVLNDAVWEGVITQEESRALLFGSLQVLLPSAAQEGAEEAGVLLRPDPEHVCSTIHRYKTGLLFHIPLLGPERIEAGISLSRMGAAKEALMQFGLGCQLLDDVRDMGRDLREQRHNYALSLLARDFPAAYAACQQGEGSDRLYHRFPEVAVPTAKRGLRSMREGLSGLDALGLGIELGGADAIALAMFRVLDLGDIEYA
jgi:hypothetical protein